MLKLDMEDLKRPFEQLAVGLDHACALDALGEITCWGDNNDSGELSPPALTFVEIDSGTNFGCGRRTSGEVECWGSDFFGLEPDLMSAAKGLTSRYLPMSACLISDKVWKVLREGSSQYGPFAHGYTYSGHPVAAAAALANLDIIEGEGLVENAAKVGAYLQTRLRETFADHPLVGEVRGVGLIARIELVKNKESKEPFDPSVAVARRLHELLMEEGLICRPMFDSLGFSPPLVLSIENVDSIVAMFSSGLEKLMPTLVS